VPRMSGVEVGLVERPPHVLSRPCSGLPRPRQKVAMLRSGNGARARQRHDTRCGHEDKGPHYQVTRGCMMATTPPTDTGPK
jgi:hypothetical protein